MYKRIESWSYKNVHKRCQSFVSFDEKRDFYGFLKSCTSAKWFCQSAIKTVRSNDLYQLSESYSDSYT